MTDRDPLKLQLANVWDQRDRLEAELASARRHRDKLDKLAVGLILFGIVFALWSHHQGYQQGLKAGRMSEAEAGLRALELEAGRH